MAWQDALAANLRPPQFTPLQAPSITQPRIISPPLAEPPRSVAASVGVVAAVSAGVASGWPARPGPARPAARAVQVLGAGVVAATGRAARSRATSRQTRPRATPSDRPAPRSGTSRATTTSAPSRRHLRGALRRGGRSLALLRGAGLRSTRTQITQAFADAVFGTLTKGAEVLEGMANTVKGAVRDEEIKSRAINYAKLVTRTATHWELVTYDDPIEKIKKISRALVGAMSYDQQRAVTMAAWDLPQDLKDAIERRPDLVFRSERSTSCSTSRSTRRAERAGAGRTPTARSPPRSTTAPTSASTSSCSMPRAARRWPAGRSGCPPPRSRAPPAGPPSRPSSAWAAPSPGSRPSCSRRRGCRGCPPCHASGRGERRPRSSSTRRGSRWAWARWP